VERWRKHRRARALPTTRDSAAAQTGRRFGRWEEDDKTPSNEVS
jgi:hypothetical protein